MVFLNRFLQVVQGIYPGYWFYWITLFVCACVRACVWMCGAILFRWYGFYVMALLFASRDSIWAMGYLVLYEMSVDSCLSCYLRWELIQHSIDYVLVALYARPGQLGSDIKGCVGIMVSSIMFVCVRVCVCVCACSLGHEKFPGEWYIALLESWFVHLRQVVNFVYIWI